MGLIMVPAIYPGFVKRPSRLKFLNLNKVLQTRIVVLPRTNNKGERRGEGRGEGRD